MADAIQISVIVPHRDDWDRLETCVGELTAQRAAVEGCEIIVVDNDSSDRARADAFRARFGDAIVFASEAEQGAACARNTGTRLARGEIFAFIDSDCRPAQDWVANILACAHTHGYCGGQVYLLPSGENVTPAEAFEKVFAFRQEYYVTNKNFSVTANLAVRRDIFDDVGLFRNGVSEDLDWGQRAAARGHRIVFCPAAVVWHPPRRSFEELRRKWRRLCREEVQLGRVNGKGLATEIGRILAVAASPFVHAPVCFTSGELCAGERWRCLVGLFYIRWYRVWRYTMELRPSAEG